MELMVHDVPARVLTRLTADARRRDVSVNDAACGILAEKYRVKREPTGAKFTKALSRPTLLLDMPDALHVKLKVDAATRKATMRGLVIASIAEHYGVKVPTPARRPRTRR